MRVAGDVADPTQHKIPTDNIREFTNQSFTFVATSANETFGLIDTADNLSGNDFAITNLEIQPAPEPSSLLLFAPLTGLIFLKRRS